MWMHRLSSGLINGVKFYRNGFNNFAIKRGTIMWTSKEEDPYFAKIVV